MSTETTTTYSKETTNKKSRNATLTALAIVGFIALIFLGIWLAIYSAQFVPSAITKLTSGLPKNDPDSGPAKLAIVPATSTAYTQNAASIPSNPVNPAALLPNIGQQSYSAPQSNQTNPNRGPHGLPDLAVTIIATGYLTTDSADSFVPAHVIPPGARPAVKFSIANNGTNVTGPWNFLSMIPSYGGTIFHSPSEQSLNPGDHVVFTLGFSQAIPGPAQSMTVVADPYNAISESNEGNNSAASAVTITASGN